MPAGHEGGHRTEFTTSTGASPEADARWLVDLVEALAEGACTEDTARVLVEAGIREHAREVGDTRPDVSAMVERVIGRLADPAAETFTPSYAMYDASGNLRREMDRMPGDEDEDDPRVVGSASSQVTVIGGAGGRFTMRGSAELRFPAAPPPPEVGMVYTVEHGAVGLIVSLPGGALRDWPFAVPGVFGDASPWNLVEVRAPFGGPTVWRRG